MSPNAENSPTNENMRLRRNEWDAHGDARERILEGFEQFGEEAFSLFLLLPDTDLANPRLLSRFTRKYVGAFEHIIDAAYDHLITAGWVTATNTFLRSEEDAGRLSWDWDKVVSSLEATHHVIEHEGRFHVFRR